MGHMRAASWGGVLAALLVFHEEGSYAFRLPAQKLSPEPSAAPFTSSADSQRVTISPRVEGWTVAKAAAASWPSAASEDRRKLEKEQPLDRSPRIIIPMVSTMAVLAAARCLNGQISCAFQGIQTQEPRDRARSCARARTASD